MSKTTKQMEACTTYKEARDLVLSWAPPKKESRAMVVGGAESDSNIVTLEVVTMIGTLKGKPVSCIWLLWPLRGKVELWQDGTMCTYARTFIPDPPNFNDTEEVQA